MNWSDAARELCDDDRKGGKNRMRQDYVIVHTSWTHRQSIKILRSATECLLHSVINDLYLRLLQNLNKLVATSHLNLDCFTTAVERGNVLTPATQLMV